MQDILCFTISYGQLGLTALPEKPKVLPMAYNFEVDHHYSIVLGTFKHLYFTIKSNSRIFLFIRYHWRPILMKITMVDHAEMRDRRATDTIHLLSSWIQKQGYCSTFKSICTQHSSNSVEWADCSSLVDISCWKNCSSSSFPLYNKTLQHLTWNESSSIQLNYASTQLSYYLLRDFGRFRAALGHLP